MLNQYSISISKNNKSIYGQIVNYLILNSSFSNICLMETTFANFATIYRFEGLQADLTVMQTELLKLGISGVFYKVTRINRIAVESLPTPF